MQDYTFAPAVKHTWDTEWPEVEANVSRTARFCHFLHCISFRQLDSGMKMTSIGMKCTRVTDRVTICALDQN